MPIMGLYAYYYFIARVYRDNFLTLFFVLFSFFLALFGLEVFTSLIVLFLNPMDGLDWGAVLCAFHDTQT